MKLPAYIMVIALLVMNIASAALADCAGDAMCDVTSSITSSDIDNQHNDGDQQNSGCDCCASCGHHVHASIDSGKTERLSANSQTHRIWGGVSYSSQLNSPPFQPPKA